MLHADARADLEKLASETLAMVLDAVHVVVARDLREGILDILWTRHAATGYGWPLTLRRIGTPHGVQLVGRGVDRTCEIVGFHRAANGPDDPEHQPARTLDWSYVGANGKMRKLSGIECSCGVRLQPHQTRDQRADPSSSVWPMVSDQSLANNGVPYYLICKRARGVDDANHCPDDAFAICLCLTDLTDAEYRSVQ